MNRPSSEADYPFEEFVKQFADQPIFRDYEHVELGGEMIEIGPERSFEAHSLRMLDYFLAHYPRERVPDYMAWFVIINRWMTINIESFLQRDLAILGSGEGPVSISEKLLKAVHHLFVHGTDEEWAREGGPDRERVHELCRTIFKDYGED